MASPRRSRNGSGSSGRVLFGLCRPLAAPPPEDLLERLPTPVLRWSRPTAGVRVTGFGVAAEAQGSDPARVLAEVAGTSLRWLAPAQHGVPGPWFGGVAFDPSRPAGPRWAGFPPARFVVPATVLWEAAGAAGVMCFTEAPSPAMAGARLEAALGEVTRALSAPGPAPSPTPRVTGRHGDPEAWAALVERGLASIRAGALEKVVLARPIDLTFAGPLRPGPVLARLEATYPGCTTFLFTGGDAAFVGATPETLFEVEGRVLHTEALAGSAPPGGRFQDKERREHLAVVDAIRAGLAPLSTRLQVAAEPQVLTLPNVLHLRTPVSATLRPRVDAGAVLAALHPTPAVGGTPRGEALAFLRAHEGFDRGWYTGAVGWLGPEGAHLTVGLRSALFRGDRARLFVGAGVVEGSSAEAEWQETEVKSLPLWRALGGEDGGAEP